MAFKTKKQARKYFKEKFIDLMMGNDKFRLVKMEELKKVVQDIDKSDKDDWKKFIGLYEKFNERCI